jgi:hypothetical protein
MEDFIIVKKKQNKNKYFKITNDNNNNVCIIGTFDCYEINIIDFDKYKINISKTIKNIYFPLSLSTRNNDIKIQIEYIKINNLNCDELYVLCGLHKEGDISLSWTETNKINETNNDCVVRCMNEEIGLDICDILKLNHIFISYEKNKEYALYCINLNECCNYSNKNKNKKLFENDGKYKYKTDVIIYGNYHIINNFLINIHTFSKSSLNEALNINMIVCVPYNYIDEHIINNL